MRHLVKVHKALSDESRLRVLNLLLERECCVCEVMQALEISQSKASRILSALYDVGFLKLRKDGLWSLYSIDQEGMDAHLKDILEATRRAFEGFGQVASATIIRDRTSGRSRGFGFVEMPNKAEADAAITGLNGKKLKGQPIVVNEARPRSEGRRDNGEKPSL